ncbi:protein kinase [Gemmatimonadota bacterium]
MIGRTISHYKVVDKLGEGGMGAVYKAEDTTLNRLVAIKALSSHLSENDEARERFIREAQAASAINHSNITTVYELLEDEGEQFIVMEYVDGKTIRDVVESSRVSIRKAVDILIQAAEALGAAHNKGILHRDVKSANIMVSMEGNVKVMDFGLAHLEDRSQLTRTGTTMGTLAYSSPEQLVGATVDKRSEIFSLGVVFYELLTGQLPFKSPSEGELVFEIINTEQDQLTTCREDVPENVCSVINKMLIKNPELRYQSCRELLNDLNAIRAELETTTVEISTARGAVGTKKKVVVAGIISAVAIIGVVIALVLGGGGPKYDPNRVVIAPFRNQTGNEEADPWGDIVAFQINQGLQRIGTVDFVPTPDARLSWAHIHSMVGSREITTGPLEALAADFNAGIVVSGFYTLLGDSLQFWAEIADVMGRKSRETIGPETASIKRPNEAIERLAERVLGHFAMASDERVAVGGSPSMAAWRAFDRGLDYYLGGGGSFDEALQAFYEANELDPDFHLSHIYATMVLANIVNLEDPTRKSELDSVITLLIQVRDQLSEYENCLVEVKFQSSQKNPGYRDRMYMANKRAAELAPQSKTVMNFGISALRTNRPAEAVRVLESLDAERGPMRGFSSFPSWKREAYHLLGDHKGELASARQGRELYPEAMEGWQYRNEEIVALSAQGSIEEVNRLIEECLLLAPTNDFSPGSVMRRAARELVAHDHSRAEANRLWERAIEWYKNELGRATPRRGSIADALYCLDRWDDAHALYEVLSLENPNSVTYQGRLGTLAARRSDRQEALRISKWLEEIEFSTPVNRTYLRARIATQLGDMMEAVTLLKEAFSRGLTYLNIHDDRDLFPLRDYPLFQELMRPKG